MKVYVTRMSADWNADYVGVFKTLEQVADEILEMCEEDLVFPCEKKELVKHMKAREKEGYVYLLDTDKFEDFPDEWGFEVLRTKLL